MFTYNKDKHNTVVHTDDYYTPECYIRWLAVVEEIGKNEYMCRVLNSQMGCAHKYRVQAEDEKTAGKMAIEIYKHAPIEED